MNYDIFKPWLTLDTWQKKYIADEGNCFVLCGRQSGKTTAMSIKFGERAVNKPKQIILMIALTEKQAYNLFFKTLTYLQQTHPRLIKGGREKPTKHEINLTNGSKIMCYAAGLTGEGLRTYTLTSLVIDEAAPMAREVFLSVTPMLSVTGGTIDIASTGKGKQGYFYECSLSDRFTKYRISAEDCPRHSKEFLEDEKKRMSEKEYAQEYLAVFIEDLQRVFDEKIIKKCCTLKRPEHIDKEFRYYLGVDIARMGKDQSTFEIIQKVTKDKFKHVQSIITTKTLTTQTEAKIIELNELYDFREIDIDAGSGSLGVGIFDHLLENDKTKRKVIAINNRSRPYDRDESKKDKLLKEDLYNNLLSMMEQGRIELLNDDELIASLASVQYEYVVKEGQPTKLRIFGNYTHVAEGLIRAAWAAAKDKSLNIWVR